jgi:hypothetical protein
MTMLLTTNKISDWMRNRSYVRIYDNFIKGVSLVCVDEEGLEDANLEVRFSQAAEAMREEDGTIAYPEAG